MTVVTEDRISRLRMMMKELSRLPAPNESFHQLRVRVLDAILLIADEMERLQHRAPVPAPAVGRELASLNAWVVMKPGEPFGQRSHIYKTREEANSTLGVMHGAYGVVPVKVRVTTNETAVHLDPCGFYLNDEPPVRCTLRAGHRGAHKGGRP